MNHKQRLLTSMGVAAGLVAGGGAGLILQSTGSAGAAATVAAVAPATTIATTDATGAATNTSNADGSGTATTPARPKVAARLQEILQPLIDDGTLTQAQVDAVIAKVDAARPVAGEGRHGHDGRHEPGIRGMRGVRIEFANVATLLGVTKADLRNALEDGTTISAYAESKGKTGQDVIDLLVADTKAHLDAKVADGSLTQAKADTKLVTATTFITDFVNNGRPATPARPAAPPTSDTPDSPAPTAG